MTGRDLALVLVAAGLAGGAAGAASTLLSPDRDESSAASPEQAALAARLDAAEDELSRTRKALAESSRSITSLREEIRTAEAERAKETKERQLGEALRNAAGVARRPGSAFAKTQVVQGDGDAPIEFGGVDLAGLDDVKLGDAIHVELGKAIDGVPEGLRRITAFGEFGEGMKLRALPEEQRWQKAKDELSLSWNQVEDLRKAVADRDAAMKDAFTTEKRAAGNGGQITIQRSDPAKALRAQADYQERVNKALDEKQRGDWRSKGYDHAFGTPFGGGGAAVSIMTLGLTNETKTDDAPKKEESK